MSRVRILDGSFDPLTLQGTVDRSMQLVRSGTRGYVCTVNTAILMMMRSDARLDAFVGGSSLVVADGQPLIWASRLLKARLPERVAGVDLVDALSARAEREGLGVYLLGSQSDVVELVAKQLVSRYPGLRVCGVDDGYFSADEASERARIIQRSGAEILFVGMGVPRQEYFLEDHWSELGVQLAIGVGGSFEVLAGVRRRAPLWIQKVGMEWAYRLVQEPRRLWKRYLVTNSRFLYCLGRELVSRMLRPRRSDRAS